MLCGIVWYKYFDDVNYSCDFAGLEPGYSCGGEDVQVVGPHILPVQVGAGGGAVVYDFLKPELKKVKEMFPKNIHR